METQFLVVFYFSLGSVVNNEVRLEVSQLFFRRLDEHIRYEMCLPSNFYDEADSHAGVFVGTAESIYNVEFLVGQFLFSDFFQSVPGFRRSSVVIVVIILGIPPNSVMGSLIVNDEFIFRRTAGENTSLYVNSAQFGNLTLFVAC